MKLRIQSPSALLLVQPLQAQWLDAAGHALAQPLRPRCLCASWLT